MSLCYIIIKYIVMIIKIWTAVVDEKLENLLRWSFFTFIYNRSSYINYFI